MKAYFRVLLFVACLGAAILFVTRISSPEKRIIQHDKTEKPLKIQTRVEKSDSKSKTEKPLEIQTRVEKRDSKSKPIDEAALFSFVPHVNCDDLFQGKSPASLQFQTEYKHVSLLIEEELNRLRAKKVGMEGHSGQMQKQTFTYQTLANASFVKTVCETGFNAGHSALLFLSTKADIHVHSFDLGAHPYGRPMADLLQKTFPGRLDVTWGDSKVTVPAFAKSHPEVKCDIIIVDGGHNYREAKADLQNFRALAKKSYNILIIDDHPADTLPGVKRAWQEELASYQLQEHFRCNFYSDQRRGFTVGKYLNL